MGVGATQIPETTSAMTATTAQVKYYDLGDASVIQRLHILPYGRGERVVRATPPTFRKKVLLCVRAREQRKFRDPEKVRGTRWVICPCAAS